MNIAAINGMSTAATDAPKAPSRDEKTIEQSAKQFEAMIVRQVLSDTFKPSPTAAKGQSMPGSDIYQSFMTDTVADSISQSGALGISHLLQSQLTTPTKPAHAGSAASRKPAV